MKLYKLPWARLILFFFKSFICLPHVFLFLICKNRAVLSRDINKWIDYTVEEHHCLCFDLLYLLVFYKEFRNLFYLRLGKLTWLVRYLRPLSSLYINTSSENFGAGTFIQHGFATVITAEYIGENCWINQQVTIGYNKSKKYGFGKPIIGDNVRISCGAKVVGKIKVGDGSTIGVNAVIVKDVPPNSTVVPSPMYLIQENGISVLKKF